MFSSRSLITRPSAASIHAMSLGSRGPWRKVKVIGKGAFGSAYLVQRTGRPDERKFVMKEVPLRGLPPREVSAAKNEVAALKRLEHKHIVAYEDAIVVDETLCIVMEWAHGGDLSALLAKRKRENKPLSEDEVLRIFWQLTSALAHLHHGHHMLHRDLKPQNVFLTSDLDVKLGDFGLAKVVEATCALNKTQCGTPAYMSPELCKGENYNRAADVWALGCVLYELMTLTAPWADMKFNGAGGMTALLKKIANADLDLTPCRRRYSSELCALLAMLLHKRGGCRPALNNVLLLDVMQKAAPKQPDPPQRPESPSGDERRLPPSWRKVPSASRPGEFSYLHEPTGFKQAAFPDSDEPSAQALESVRKALGERGQAAAPRLPPPTPSNAASAAEAARAAAAAARVAAARLGGAPSAARPAAVRPKPLAGSPREGAVEKSSDEVQTFVPLPASWRKVPSASRPGQFSYQHMLTGYKQIQLPSSDEPEPEMLAAWLKANAMAHAGAAPPPTAGEPPSRLADRRAPRFGALAPVHEISDPTASPADGKPPAKRQLPNAAQPGPGLRRVWTPQHLHRAVQLTEADVAGSKPTRPANGRVQTPQLADPARLPIIFRVHR